MLRPGEMIEKIKRLRAADEAKKKRDAEKKRLGVDLIVKPLPETDFATRYAAAQHPPPQTVPVEEPWPIPQVTIFGLTNLDGTPLIPPIEPGPISKSAVPIPRGTAKAEAAVPKTRGPIGEKEWDRIVGMHKDTPEKYNPATDPDLINPKPPKPIQMAEPVYQPGTIRGVLDMDGFPIIPDIKSDRQIKLDDLAARAEAKKLAAANLQTQSTTVTSTLAVEGEQEKKVEAAEKPTVIVKLVAEQLPPKPVAPAEKASVDITLRQPKTPLVEGCGYVEVSFSRSRSLHGIQFAQTIAEVHAEEALCKNEKFAPYLNSQLGDTVYDSKLMFQFNAKDVGFTRPLTGVTKQVDVCLSLIDYKVNFKVEASIFPHWAADVKRLSLVNCEHLEDLADTYATMGLIRLILAKIDAPSPAGLYAAYTSYLAAKRRKRLTEMKMAGDTAQAFFSRNFDKFQPEEVSNLKDIYHKDFSNVLSRSNERSPKWNVFELKSAEAMLTLLLALRGEGPKELTFLRHYLKSARYRPLLYFTPEERKVALAYIVSPLSKPKTQQTNTQPKKIVRRLICKLIATRLRQKHFQKHLLRFLRATSSLTLRAAAEPIAPVYYRDPADFRQTRDDDAFKQEMEAVNKVLATLSAEVLELQSEDRSRKQQGEEIKNIQKQRLDLISDVTILVEDLGSLKIAKVAAENNIISLKSSLNKLQGELEGGKRGVQDELTEIKKTLFSQQQALAEVRQQGFQLIHQQTPEQEALKETVRGLQEQIQKGQKVANASFKAIAVLHAKIEHQANVPSAIDDIDLVEYKKMLKLGEADMQRFREEHEQVLKTIGNKTTTQVTQFQKDCDKTLQNALSDFAKRQQEMRNDLHDTITNLPGDFRREARGLEQQFIEVTHLVKQLGVFELKTEMELSRMQHMTFEKSLPSLEHRAKAAHMLLESQADALVEARILLRDLKSATTDAFAKAAAAKRLEENKQHVDIIKHRRQGKSLKRAKTAAARSNIAEEHPDYEEESIHTRKTVSFIPAKGSLQNGDIFLYRGQPLIVSDEFNPSRRVQHSGQNGDVWECQKYANLFWYYKEQLRT